MDVEAEEVDRLVGAQPLLLRLGQAFVRRRPVEREKLWAEVPLVGVESLWPLQVGVGVAEPRLVANAGVGRDARGVDDGAYTVEPVRYAIDGAVGQVVRGRLRPADPVLTEPGAGQRLGGGVCSPGGGRLLEERGSSPKA